MERMPPVSCVLPAACSSFAAVGTANDKYDIRLRIPVRPHVLKYVAYYTGAPFRLSKENSFGILIYNMLVRERDARRELVTADYTEELHVMVPERYYRYYGHELNLEQVKHFNDHAHDCLKREFRHVLDARLELVEEHCLGVEIQEGIWQFMDRFDLHLVMNFETLKKDYYRYRKRKEGAKKPLRA